MRELEKLTAAAVENATEQGRHSDGGGLYLQVSCTGTKSWLLRYQLNGQRREMGLGAFPWITLSKARAAARAAQTLVEADIDPIDRRADERRAKIERARAIKEAAARLITFKVAAERFIEGRKSGWKNKKHSKQWLATLETYAFPSIGELSVAEITTDHVTDILRPIWTERTDTASKLRGRIEQILDWAAIHRYRSGENPARWRGHLSYVFQPKNKVRKIKHQPALPYTEMSAFMAELRTNSFISARALEFTILTASRTNETIKATWDEFDLAEGIWTVPADRMKAGREHRVPLSGRVLEILKSLSRERGSPYVFPGGRKGRPLSNMAMLELVKHMRKGVVVHGFRSSFRDWISETTNFQPELGEAALAHVNGDKTEAAYRRGDALQKRRKLMETWANYCAAAPKAGNVVATIRRTA